LREKEPDLSYPFMAKFFSEICAGKMSMKAGILKRVPRYIVAYIATRLDTSAERKGNK
jgi:hypothetical protein